MQVFLFLFLSLHLLSLQLQSLFKLSFVIIKQQCKQLSQKPLPKLLEMISSVLPVWPKKIIIFPNGGLYTLHYGFSTASSLNWEREWSTGIFCLVVWTNTNAKWSKLPTWRTVGSNCNSQEALSSHGENEWKLNNLSVTVFIKSQLLKSYKNLPESSSLLSWFNLHCKKELVT